MKEENWAKFISGISHPLFVLVLGMSFGLYSLVIQYDPFQYIAFLFLVTVIPVYFYLWQLFKENRNGNGFALSRENRNIVYLSALFGAVFAVVITKAFNMNYFWMYIAMLLTVLFGILYFVNKFIDKMSFHTYSWGFTMIFLANAISLWWLVGLIGLPLIAQSRLVLEKHNKFQLFIGAALGMFIGLISWTFV